ncbi:hypothetical protein HOD75_03120 [archaeon]|jgi:hypothetical protein|nr:hypothetical protein [archaeon]MBT4241864.1 hypothetical protein [archaeon]MBT4418411.1 hypothetical protein [archaeon]
MKKTLGLILIVIGIFLVTIKPLPITGAVIGIDSISNITPIIGLITLIIGVILFSTNLEGTVSIENIEKTRQFQKATKGINKKILQRAIDKIGTQLGNQKPGRYQNTPNSIRVDKGGRIFYQQVGDRIILTQYAPSSKHH